MSSVWLLTIFCAISIVLMALGSFFHRQRLSYILCVLWLAAALPVMLLTGLTGRFVLLFYLISGGAGLAMHMGGKQV